MIRFRLAPHSIRSGVEIVEVWDDNRFMATLSPEANEIIMTSKYEVRVRGVGPMQASLRFG